jgi:uncharacterized protein DUF4190
VIRVDTVTKVESGLAHSSGRSEFDFGSSMKSIKCPACGLVGWADDEGCKKCGVLRVAEPVAASEPSSPTYLEYKARGGEHSQRQLKKGLAVTSLVIGIVDVFTFGLLGLGAIAGMTLAIVALVKAKRYPHEYGGQSLATAGLVTSILSLIILPIGIGWTIALPDVVAKPRADNEGASFQVLRKIPLAEAKYQSNNGERAYGTLDQLAAEGLIDSELATGVSNGYKFTLEVKQGEHGRSPEFRMVAVPLTYGITGIRSFYVDENSVIRGGDHQGEAATAHSPPLANGVTN